MVIYRKGHVTGRKIPGGFLQLKAYIHMITDDDDGSGGAATTTTLTIIMVPMIMITSGPQRVVKEYYRLAYSTIVFTDEIPGKKLTPGKII